MAPARNYANQEMAIFPMNGAMRDTVVCTLPEFEDEEVNVRECLRHQCKGACSATFFKRKLPITSWLPQYSVGWLVADFLAGLTVGMTAIPQGIAYAGVAGLAPQYGLYSGFMGAFVYIILGSCKDITIGPTAILALMCQKAVENSGADYAVLLCFISGCIILLMGLLNLGFLVTFISMPVTTGFTTAAAITIASSQLKSLLGIPGKSNEFLESWITVIDHISETKLWDTVLGVSTIILLLLGKYLNNAQLKRENLSTLQKIYNKIIWLISLGRNAIVAILGTALAYYFYTKDESPFVITGPIAEGLPPFKVPPFSTESNGTTVTFGGMLGELGASSITIPLISVLESIAIAKAFSKGKALDATQEMIALGMCNILGSFVRSMPTTGSFTRTAVNNASGVVTPLGGAVTGALVLLTLGLLTSTFQYIPKATLAGIIIAAMFFMVEYEIVPLLWKTRKADLIPFFVTVAVCLFVGLEFGIISGIAVNLLFVLYDAARPRVSIQCSKVHSHDVLLVAPDYSIVFPAAEFVRKKIIKKCIELDNKAIVILDGRYMRHIDATVAKNLHSLWGDLKIREQKLLFWNWNRSSRFTLCGIDPKLSALFQEGTTLEDIFKERPVDENGSV
ncbi:hypothetical protein R5R35_003712 [Gryllus longicercus]